MPEIVMVSPVLNPGKQVAIPGQPTLLLPPSRLSVPRPVSLRARREHEQVDLDDLNNCLVHAASPVLPYLLL